MLLRFLYLWIMLLCDVRSDLISESLFTDMNNNTIEVTEHCKRNNCIVKCCPEDQIIAATPQNETDTCVSSKNIADIDFTNISVYRRQRGRSTSPPVARTNKTLKHDFVLLHNDIFWDTHYEIYTYYWVQFYILEDGSLDPDMFSPQDQLHYCVDFYNDSGEIKFAYRAITVVETSDKYKKYFTVAGLVVSSFFMILVLVVYGVVPELRKVVGLILMACLLTMTCFFVARAVQLYLLLRSEPPSKEQCLVLSSVVYYFTMSSFFWLNVMSLNLWRAVTEQCNRRALNSPGTGKLSRQEVRQFVWYCLYACGVPVLLTLGEVFLDKSHLLQDTTATFIHVHVPIGVMTAVNWALFLKVVFTIWKTGHAFSRFSKHGYTAYRCSVYIKISVVMGVSWILEMVPEQSLVLDIIINACNLFIGLSIFIVFVCKKSTLVMLCKRLQIKTKFVDSLQISQRTISTSTGRSSRKRSDDLHKDNKEAVQLAAGT